MEKKDLLKKQGYVNKPEKLKSKSKNIKEKIKKLKKQGYVNKPEKLKSKSKNIKEKIKKLKKQGYDTSLLNKIKNKKIK